jgi:hypothetical protein
VDDLVDCAWWDPDGDCKFVLGDAEAFNEVLHEGFARVDGCEFLSGSQRSLPSLLRDLSDYNRFANDH